MSIDPIKVIIAIFAVMMAVFVIGTLWGWTYKLVPAWREPMDRIGRRAQSIWENRIFPPVALAVIALIVIGPYLIDRPKVSAEAFAGEQHDHPRIDQD